MRQSARERALALAIPGSGSEGTARMTNTGPRQIRDAANELLDAFIRAIEQSYAGRPVNAADLRRVADALKGSPDFDALFDRAFSDVQSQALAHALAQAHDAQRVEMFHRVLTHPLDPLLDAEVISRDALPNFFNFLRLVLGDAVDAFQERCVAAHDEIKAKAGEDFTWDIFYADARAKLVLYEVLMRIADAFKRFDARKQWFIGLMQYSPTTIGVASNVFVPNPKAGKWVFGESEFTEMFRHLFQPVRTLTKPEYELFATKLGRTPEDAFQPLFGNLG
ncbi:MAG TPA: hypothetical protein VGB82_28455 [Alphaproteobacteria bacterium]